MPKKTTSAVSKISATKKKSTARFPKVEKPATKKTTRTSAPAPASNSEVNLDDFKEDVFAQEVVGAITDGEFDFVIADLFDAIEQRLIAVDEENKKQEAKNKATATAPRKPAEKKVAAPPRKRATQPAVAKPEAGKTYVVAPGLSKLAGAKVEFVSMKDEVKAIVVMQDAKPGAPKGKRVVIPANALTPASASNTTRRRPAKKTAAKKG